MLHSVGDNPTTFIHAAIDGENHALRDEVTALCEQKPNVAVHFRYSTPTREDVRDANHHSSGFITEEFLVDHITPETEVYFCGPKPMMQHIYKALKAIRHPEAQTHFEFFGPQEELEA